VHLCVDVRQRRLVVVKWLRSELSEGSEAASRFRREAELMSGLRSDGVIKVEDYNSDEMGRTWMAMEFVDGRSPAAAAQPGDAWAAHRLLVGVGESLDELHGLGVVHRDLKPDNIILRNAPADGSGGWEPVIIDLGIAKWLAYETATATGSVFGTPHYMSPEQFRDTKHVGPATDRYALAIIVFELISGVLPYDGRSLPELLHQHMDGVIPPLKVPVQSSVNPRSATLPGTEDPTLHETPNLDAFMAIAMAKEPHARYEGGGDMAQAFRDAAMADGIWTTPDRLVPLFDGLPAPTVDVTSPDGSVQRFDVREGPVVIGRHEACQVVLSSPRLSRLHACIYTHRGRLWIGDLQSQNGTAVDGRNLTSGVPAPVPLDGREISVKLYDHEFKVRAAPP
jgi:serine/threonine protein kinase